jgi:hypothetical protein
MLKNIIWNLLGKKYLLGSVVQIYKFFNGYKTQLCTAGIAVVYALKTFQLIPADLADQLIALLGGGGGISLLHKLQKYDEDYKIQERAAELRALALEQLQKDGVIAAPVTNPPIPPELREPPPPPEPPTAPYYSKAGEIVYPPKTPPDDKAVRG